jgi:hypothetical protein
LYENDSKAVYGMIASIPDERVTEDFITRYMDHIYKYEEKEKRGSALSGVL